MPQHEGSLGPQALMQHIELAAPVVVKGWGLRNAFRMVGEAGQAITAMTAVGGWPNGDAELVSEGQTLCG